MSNLNITKSLENIRKEVERLNDLKDGLINLILGKNKLKSSIKSIEDRIVNFGKDIEKLTILDEQIVQYYFEQFNKYKFFYENSGCIKLNENIFKPANNGKYCFKPVKEEIRKVSYEKLEKILNTLKNTKIQYNAQSSNNEDSVTGNNNNEGSGSRNSQLTRLMNAYSSNLEKDDLEVLKNILESQNINLNNTNEINEIIKKIQIEKIENLVGSQKTNKTVVFYKEKSYNQLKNTLSSRNDLSEIYRAALTSSSFERRRRFINNFNKQLLFKKYFLNIIFKGTNSYEEINSLINKLLYNTPRDLKSSNDYKKIKLHMDALYIAYGILLLKIRNDKEITKFDKRKDIFNNFKTPKLIMSEFNKLLSEDIDIKNYEGLINYIKTSKRQILTMYTYTELKSFTKKNNL